MNQYTAVCRKGEGGVNDSHLPDVTITLTLQIKQKVTALMLLLKLQCHVQESSSCLQHTGP